MYKYRQKVMTRKPKNFEKERILVAVGILSATEKSKI
jgi:hypothetical protein